MKKKVNEMREVVVIVVRPVNAEVLLRPITM